MSKFNITVDFDWLNDECDVESEIKEQIISGVARKVEEKILSQAETECKSKFDNLLKNAEQVISEKLNRMMTDFFDTPHDITDNYGDVVQRGVTVKDTLKKACDNFLNEPLDRNGKPARSSYDTEYKTRVDYIVSKSIDHNMEWAIKSAVSAVTDNLRKKISNEIKTQMGDKLAEVLDLDKIIKGK